MTGRLAPCALLLLLLSAAPGWSFDYARYQAADLDEILAQRRPETGMDVFPMRSLRLEVTLAAYDRPCNTSWLKMAMIATGIPKAQVDGTAFTRCIQVRSAKGQVVTVPFQDQLTAGLRDDVNLGGPLTLFAIHVYTSQEGPGMLVTAFVTGHNVDVNKPAAPADQAAAAQSDCGCGRADEHPGVDHTAPEGTPVRVAAGGIVVKVEPDEQATVDVPGGSTCGRYVVVRHSHRDGRVVFTRYAQLGRLVGRDGKPLTVGTRVKKDDQVALVGSRQILHFEVRPLDRATMDTRPVWSRRYGADPAMEWTRYHPVDPQTFVFDGFGATTARSSTAK